MKHYHQNRNAVALAYTRQPAYPNAADTNYFSRKARDILAAVVSGMGCIAGMVFLVIIA